MKKVNATEVAPMFHNEVTKNYRNPKTLKEVLHEIGYINNDGSFNKDGFLNLKGR